METLQFEYRNGQARAGSPSATTGVVGSGNLEVLVEPAELGGACRIEILTAAVGFGPIWQAVWMTSSPPSAAGCCLSINDVGATPAVVSLRLDQAVRSFTGPSHEAQLLRDSARERLLGLLDDGSFREILPLKGWSIPLRQLDTPAAFDDGIIVGRGTLDGNPVLVAAQEGGFMGGAVGEVHGAKLADCWSAPSTSGRPPSCCWSNPAACACTRPTPA